MLTSAKMSASQQVKLYLSTVSNLLQYKLYDGKHFSIDMKLGPYPVSVLTALDLPGDVLEHAKEIMEKEWVKRAAQYEHVTYEFWENMIHYMKESGCYMKGLPTFHKNIKSLDVTADGNELNLRITTMLGLAATNAAPIYISIPAKEIEFVPPSVSSLSAYSHDAVRPIEVSAPGIDVLMNIKKSVHGPDARDVETFSFAVPEGTVFNFHLYQQAVKNLLVTWVNNRLPKAREIENIVEEGGTLTKMDWKLKDGSFSFKMVFDVPGSKWTEISMIMNDRLIREPIFVSLDQHLFQ